MKEGVPALNAFVAVIYMAMAGLCAFCLKMATRPTAIVNPQLQSSALLSKKQSMNFHKLLALSLLKKCTIVGSFFSANKKYLIKEILIVSAYAISCLKINRLIMTPIILSLIILPICLFLMDFLPNKLSQCHFNQSELTVNNIQNQDIQIQAIRIQQSDLQQKIVKKSQKTLSETLIMSGLCIIGVLMLWQTILELTNSISNTGQLNIGSVGLIIIFDQLIFRVIFCLTFFGVLQILQLVSLIDLKTNWLVEMICSQQIVNQLVEIQKDKIRKQLQVSSSPLKKISSNQDLGVDYMNINMDQIEHQHISSHSEAMKVINQSQSQVVKPMISVKQQEDQSQYLTTPQKQLFDKEQQGQNGQNLQEEGFNIALQQNVLKQMDGNQENDGSELNQSAINNKSTIIDNSTVRDGHKNSIQDILVLMKDRQSIEHQNANDLYFDRSRKKHSQGQKRKPRRVLKLTGNSPYLEYLPNMLKNVDSYRQKVQKEKEVKML